ncbi:hypothetical protein [Nonomuraea sp. NPDC048826]|uniref:hypothetical protein n=1 Tax=Nonomuraea sp. NPDC048826 TaxID=3364347 RepID=UPI003715A032
MEKQQRSAPVKRAALLAGIVVAIVLQALLVAGPAAASAGKVILYRNADFTAPTATRTYTTCAGTATFTGPVGSFDNRPPPGCAVTLQTRTGAVFTLCAGRGIVPPAYRDATRAAIKPGASAPCALT